MKAGLAALICVAAALIGSAPSARVPDAPRRIVSVIPAVTEMLFAIGAGPRVVGVSSFDHFPPEVDRMTRVGALLDPDLERIISLKPDLVMVFDTQTDLRAQLQHAGIPIWVYSHSGLADVTVTLRRIGERVGSAAEANALADRIENRIRALRSAVAGRPRPRTLIVLGREPGALRGIYVSGGIGFIDDMVSAAGGANVFADVKRQSLQATTEMILVKRPEVVLELRGSDRAGTLQRDAVAWNALPGLPAVRTGRVVTLADDRIVVPGPRIADGVELIARGLHQ